MSNRNGKYKWPFAGLQNLNTDVGIQQSSFGSLSPEGPFACVLTCLYTYSNAVLKDVHKIFVGCLLNKVMQNKIIDIIKVNHE